MSIRKRYLPFNIPISRINNYIYLGNIDDASNRSKWVNLNIYYILNTTKEIPNFFPNFFIYKKLNVIDNPNFDYFPYLNEAADFIYNSIKKKKKVFVHCYCGISRSTTAIIAYNLKYNNLSLKEILNELKSKRIIINPNKGFIKQLIKFQNLYTNKIEKKSFINNDNKYNRNKYYNNFVLNNYMNNNNRLKTNIKLKYNSIDLNINKRNSKINSNNDYINNLKRKYNIKY